MAVNGPVVAVLLGSNSSDSPVAVRSIPT